MDITDTMMSLKDTPLFQVIMRLVAAAFCGVLIGLERELRAKEAGVRTHFLVCFGSALFMVVSVYGFLSMTDPSLVSVTEAINIANGQDFRRFDQARIAAQIVSGIGFIGAGTIMVNRGSITGLTTAAGLWVAAGIGMAIGCGLYVIGLVATVFVLIGLEMLRLFFHKERLNSMVVYKTANRGLIPQIEQELRNRGWNIVSHDMAVKGKGNDAFRVTLTLQKHASMSDEALVTFLQSFPDVTLEKIDSQK
ncbi:MAG: MgtC/SapB family protein [Lentisphaeria bacterium]|nr:MgtC/SapB family protein [Lentisphaeria bacterium]